jgi:hypothetical protein
MNDFITLLSIALVPLTIVASIAVVYIFRTPFIKALSHKDKTAVQWMIIGIVINFIGAVFDNLWWLIAWSFHFVDPVSPYKVFFFDHGSYSNVIFRQICGIIGAMCHIFSGAMARNKTIKRVTISGGILGVMWIGYLLYLRG